MGRTWRIDCSWNGRCRQSSVQIGGALQVQPTQKARCWEYNQVPRALSRDLAVFCAGLIRRRR